MTDNRFYNGDAPWCIEPEKQGATEVAAEEAKPESEPWFITLMRTGEVWFSPVRWMKKSEQ